MRAIVFLSLICLTCSTKADIYTSVSVSGVEKWSTQALDASYTKSTILEARSVQPQKLLNENAAAVISLAPTRKVAGAKQIEFTGIIRQISTKYGVDPELVEALVAVESGFNTQAISPKGARGLMQLMPATAKRYGMKNVQELHAPAKNIDMGVRHLKELLNLHNGQVSLAIASYNAGQGAVSKYGQRIPQYRETMIYVPAVLAYMARSANSNQVLSKEFKQE